MAEYAKYNGQEIEIGKNESMLFLRFEDRFKVQPLPGNVDPVRDAHELRFRPPFPDEDGIEPGGYDDPFRGIRLYKSMNPEAVVYHERYSEEFRDASRVSDPGVIQLTHPSGLLVNVKCYHGQKLPEASDDFEAFWNGKSWALEFTQLRPVREDDGELRVYPVVRCRHCRHNWRYDWADILDFIPDATLRERLAQYAPVSIASESEEEAAEAKSKA